MGEAKRRKKLDPNYGSGSHAEKLEKAIEEDPNSSHPWFGTYSLNRVPAARKAISRVLLKYPGYCTDEIHFGDRISIFVIKKSEG